MATEASPSEPGWHLTDADAVVHAPRLLAGLYVGT